MGQWSSMAVAASLSPSLGGSTQAHRLEKDMVGTCRGDVDSVGPQGPGFHGNILTQAHPSWPRVLRSRQEGKGRGTGGEKRCGFSREAPRAVEEAGSLGCRHVNGGTTLPFHLTCSSFCVSSLNTCRAPGQACARWSGPSGE